MTARERETCFGVGTRRNYLSLVSLGTFVLIIGIVFLMNPFFVSHFELWIKQMTDEQNLVRPPQSLIASAVVFFGLIGVSNFFMACVRVWGERFGRRVLVDILSGVAFVLFAYLINLYDSYALTGQMVLAIEAIAIGTLIISYSIVKSAFQK